jgi:hypothetical protein
MFGGCVQGKEWKCKRLQMESFNELSIVIIVMHDNRSLCGYICFAYRTVYHKLFFILILIGLKVKLLQLLMELNWPNWD